METYHKFSDDIGKILKAKEDENSVLNNLFGRIRDKITFHYDEDVIKEIFGIYVDETAKDQKDMVFLEGKTQTIKDMNYVLAGDMNINYILQFIDDKSLSSEDKLKKLFKELADLSNIFSEIIELMMVELVKDVCEVKETE